MNIPEGYGRSQFNRMILQTRTFGRHEVCFLLAVRRAEWAALRAQDVKKGRAWNFIN